MKTLGAIIALLLSGCVSDSLRTAFDRVHNGQPDQPSRTQQVVTALVDTVNSLGNGSSYTDSSYCEPQHGTITATSITPGEWPTRTYINY